MYITITNKQMVQLTDILSMPYYQFSSCHTIVLSRDIPFRLLEHEYSFLFMSFLSRLRLIFHDFLFLHAWYDTRHRNLDTRIHNSMTLLLVIVIARQNNTHSCYKVCITIYDIEAQSGNEKRDIIRDFWILEWSLNDPYSSVEFGLWKASYKYRGMQNFSVLCIRVSRRDSKIRRKICASIFHLQSPTALNLSLLSLPHQIVRIMIVSGVVFFINLPLLQSRYVHVLCTHLNRILKSVCFPRVFLTDDTWKFQRNMHRTFLLSLSISSCLSHAVTN